MSDRKLIKEARKIDNMREHWPLINDLANALEAANIREAALRTELELVNDLHNRASAALEALRKEASGAIKSAWKEGNEQGESRQSRIFNGFKVDKPRFDLSNAYRTAGRLKGDM